MNQNKLPIVAEILKILLTDRGSHQRLYRTARKLPALTSPRT